MMLFRSFMPLLCLVVVCPCYGQQPAATINKLQEFPASYYTTLDQKLTSLHQRLTNKSLTFLTKFQQHERRLQKKLKRLKNTDSSVLQTGDLKYAQLAGNLEQNLSNNPEDSSIINPYVDTLSTTLNFLQKFTAGTQVAKPIKSLSALQSRFQQSENIKQFVAQRKLQLKQLLSKYTRIPASLRHAYGRLNKAAYYYSAQVNEYKELLKDPSTLEKKALAVLVKLPAFQQFMRKNSQLASLFRIPENNSGEDEAGSFTGLQTRGSIQALIQQQVNSGDANARKVIQQNFDLAHTELNKLKDLAQKNGSNASDADMPDFKPNDQKTKSFFKRLELGTTVQNQTSQSVFPTTSNVGLSVGYRISGNTIMGMAGSFKMGWGRNLQHISISNQGGSIRSFIEIKYKKSLWITGGFEMNYINHINTPEVLQQIRRWQQGCLVGISRKLPANTRFLKNSQLQLLFDLLSYQQVPKTQPVKFRIGYNLK